MLAKAESQATLMLDVPAPSPASWLLQGFLVCTVYVDATKHRRSRLAGDGRESGNRDAGRAGLIASKLAPTGIFGVHSVYGRHKTP